MVGSVVYERGINCLGNRSEEENDFLLFFYVFLKFYILIKSFFEKIKSDIISKFSVKEKREMYEIGKIVYKKR